MANSLNLFMVRATRLELVQHLCREIKSYIHWMLRNEHMLVFTVICIAESVTCKRLINAQSVKLFQPHSTIRHFLIFMAC